MHWKYCLFSLLKTANWAEDLKSLWQTGGCTPDGTINGAMCQRLQSSWHDKKISGFRWRIGSWWPPGKLQYSVTYHFLIVPAVTWLEYCRYGVKHKQSINQAIGWFLIDCNDCNIWNVRHFFLIYGIFLLFIAQRS